MLWDTPVERELVIFEEAIRYFRLQTLGLCRYSMRHGGVSHDLMVKARTMDEAHRRGRWRTQTSLRRYGKETRVLSELRKVSAHVLAFGNQILRLPSLLYERGEVPPQRPPPP